MYIYRKWPYDDGGSACVRNPGPVPQQQRSFGGQTPSFDDLVLGNDGHNHVLSTTDRAEPVLLLWQLQREPIVLKRVGRREAIEKRYDTRDLLLASRFMSLAPTLHP